MLCWRARSLVLRLASVTDCCDSGGLDEIRVWNWHKIVALVDQHVVQRPASTLCLAADSLLLSRLRPDARPGPRGRVSMPPETNALLFDCIVCARCPGGCVQILRVADKL
jgi:hypothetical protein